jgi:hypothetical protein
LSGMLFRGTRSPVRYSHSNTLRRCAYFTTIVPLIPEIASR